MYRFICIFFLLAALRAKCICLYVQKRKQNVYVYIHKKKNKMHMFTYTKFEAICIALRIHKKKLQAVSRRQQEHRQQERRPQGCICLRAYIFSPHTINTQTPAGRPAGKKIKKCIHYIYTKYLFFMSKKCIHYICTRNHIPAGSSPSNGSTTTLPPRKLAGSRQKYDKSPPTTAALPPKRIPTFCRQQN